MFFDIVASVVDVDGVCVVIFSVGSVVVVVANGVVVVKVIVVLLFLLRQLSHALQTFGRLLSRIRFSLLLSHCVCRCLLMVSVRMWFGCHYCHVEMLSMRLACLA